MSIVLTQTLKMISLLFIYIFAGQRFCFQFRFCFRYNNLLYASLGSNKRVETHFLPSDPCSLACSVFIYYLCGHMAAVACKLALPTSGGRGHRNAHHTTLPAAFWHDTKDVCLFHARRVLVYCAFRRCIRKTTLNAGGEQSVFSVVNTQKSDCLNVLCCFQEAGGV